MALATMEVRQRKQAAAETVADIAAEAVEGAQEAIGKVAEKLTCLWDELPDWQKDNHYITSGYRPASASYTKSFKSLSYLHNESINIYTHLLGGIFFGVLSYILYCTLAPRYPSASKSDIYVFSAFFLGCLFCLGMSATYHTVSNHSLVIAKWWNTLDYVGIVGLIAGSFVPSVYYGFLCDRRLMIGYWVMIFIIGVCCATVSLHPYFRLPKYRPFRTSMFIAMGLSSVFPIFHGAYLFGIVEEDKNTGLRWLVAEGVAYIAGAGLYAARIPERWHPGKFDIIGSSHQIFHVLVLVGAGFHLKGTVVAFDNAHSNGSRCT